MPADCCCWAICMPRRDMARSLEEGLKRAARQRSPSAGWPIESLGAPRLITDEQIYAIATCGDLREAVRLAYARLVDWLAKELNLNRWDAYQVISQAATLELGGITTPSCCTVAAGLRRDSASRSLSN